jgi:hypothetical protein
MWLSYSKFRECWRGTCFFFLQTLGRSENYEKVSPALRGRETRESQRGLDSEVGSKASQHVQALVFSIVFSDPTTTVKWLNLPKKQMHHLNVFVVRTLTIYSLFVFQASMTAVTMLPRCLDQHCVILIKRRGQENDFLQTFFEVTKSNIFLFNKQNHIFIGNFT